MSFAHVLFRIRDKLRLQYAKLFYEHIPQGKVQDFNFSKIKHVVIIKTDGKLGDTEVMSHFYKSLLAPQDESKIFLTAVCNKNLLPIYQDIFHFDQVIECSRKPKKAEIEQICAQIDKFRADHNLSKVDLVVNTEPNSRPRDFIFYHNLKPDYIAGFDHKVKSVNLIIPDLSNPQLKIAQCFCKLMDLGHLSYEPIQYMLMANPADLQKAKAYMGLDQTEQSKKVVIGINPFSSSASRSFAYDKVIELIHQVLRYQEQFSQFKLQVMVLCPPNEQELTNKVKQEFNVEQVLFLAPNSSIIDYAASISVLSALITVDTASVHIAEASNVPQIAFYTGVNYEDRWLPVGEQSQYVRYIGTQTSDLSSQQIAQPCAEFLERVLKQF